MYCAYFGLDEDPFAITPDPRYLYLSKRHREALAHLLFGIGAGGGFVQLTGEIGMGKTTLCRGLLEQLPDNVDVALILNPRVTAQELVATICDELHVAYPPETTSLKVLIDALNGYLLDAHARGRRTVLIIDEAQNLSTEVLEQVRLLTNLETTKQKLLQIILIGQPELQQVLEREDLRQLAQRITARYHLAALGAEETSAYVQHRLHVAGMKASPFSRAAVRYVHSLSGGIPRLINVICDRALLGAYAADQQRITKAMVGKAAQEVFSGVQWWKRRGRRREWAAAAIVIVATATVLVMVAWPINRPGSAPSPKAQTAKVQSPAVSVSPPGQASPSVKPLVPKPLALRDWLRDAGATAQSEDAAYGLLFKSAGLDYTAATGTPCERATQLGWRCVARTGTWNNLRRYRSAAVLALDDPETAAHYFVLAQTLADGQVMLQAGGRSLGFAIEAVDPLWFGAYTLLWKPPPIRVTSLLPGMHAIDVRWLRARLDVVLGPSQPPLDPVFFDDELGARVKLFQRSRGLRDDGIVGTQTLIELGLETRDAKPQAALTP